MIFVLVATTVFSEESDVVTLLDFDGDGASFPNWTYFVNVASGHPGWIVNGDHPYIEQTTAARGDRPAIYESGGYDTDNALELITSDRAPSTSSGGCLQVSDTGIGLEEHVTFWLWLDNQPLGSANAGYTYDGQGLTDGGTNRMSFYVKLSGTDEINEDGGASSVDDDAMHLGTYLCWNDGTTPYGTGDGCPYEGIGNQHYYHYFPMPMNDGWVHFQVDQHPQTRRSSGPLDTNDPVYATDGFHYFESLFQMYFEIRYDQSNLTTMLIDDVKFYNETEPQNEQSITSMWVGYWPTEDKWRIAWQDSSYAEYCDNCYSTYQIRYSTSPITNENFSSATPITPELYTGSEYTSAVGDGIIRRVEGTIRPVYTRFELPDAIESSNNRIYFAVQDISVSGGNAGSSYPWNRTDGHDAPTSLIKTIDYYLTPDSPTTTWSSSPTPTWCSTPTT